MPKSSYRFIDIQALQKLDELNQPHLPDIVQELISDFTGRKENIVQKFKTLAFAQNFQDLQIEAHSLKSAAKVIGALKLSLICQKIETLDLTNLQIDIDEYLKQLIQAYEEANQELFQIKITQHYKK